VVRMVSGITHAGEQAGVELRLPEARALAARAVAAAVGYAGAQDAETLVLAMRVRSLTQPCRRAGLCTGV